MTINPTALVHLRAQGVSVLLHVAEGRLPRIVHWGSGLADVGEADAWAIAAAATPLVAENNVDEPVFAALLPEQGGGWSGRPGLSGSRAGADWAHRFTVERVHVYPARDATVADDVPTVSSRSSESADEDPAAGAVTGFVTADGGGRVVVEAIDAVAGLDLTLTVELLAGGLLRSRAALTARHDASKGDAQVFVDVPYTVDDLVLAYPVPDHAREILDLAGRWGKEKTPQRHAFTTGAHVREGRKGRTGADAAGILHVGEAGFTFGRGQVWGVHVAFSGNHTHYAERLATGHQVIGGGELLLPGELRLHPGQTYETPWLYGSYGNGLDEVARRFHAHLRSRPTHVDTARPVTLNVWEAVYFDHDLARLLDLADRAADLGVERFVLDDGWFGSRRNDHSGLGDWTVSSDVWPDGLHPLIDRVRSRGMQFGLWVEPEMVNVDSDLARAHPDWIMGARAHSGQLPVESRHQQVLDLAIPQAYEYIRDSLTALLDEYDIAYFKWDHNRDLVEAGHQLDRGRPAVHAQTLAFYRLVAELKAAHPGLEIESCSSGGSRVDLGVLEHCDRVWTSDCIDPLDRQQMNRWTMQLLPPELMGSHIASGRSHTTGRHHDLSFRAGTALLGHLGIEWDLAAATEDELRELRAWITYYRRRRDLLLAGDVVRVDLAADDPRHLYGSVAPDRSAAVFVLAGVGRGEASPPPPLRFTGLDPGRRYEVSPVLVGSIPSGLQAPAWWGIGAGPLTGGHDGAGRTGGDLVFDDDGCLRLPGGVFAGSTLVHTGVAAPIVHPEQVVLFEAHAR